MSSTQKVRYLIVVFSQLLPLDYRVYGRYAAPRGGCTVVVMNSKSVDFPHSLSDDEIASIRSRTEQDYTDIPLVSLDIETDTSGGGGLDPTTSTIVAASLAYSDSDKVDVLDGSSEVEILQGIERVLSTRTGLLISWNGAGFDLPFLSARYRITGTATSLRVAVDTNIPAKYAPPPGLGLPVRSSWNHLAHVDIAYLYAGVAREGNVKWSLKSVAKHLGYSPVEVDRERVHALSTEEIREYVASDAHVTMKLAKLLRPQILIRSIVFLNL